MVVHVAIQLQHTFDETSEDTRFCNREAGFGLVRVLVPVLVWGREKDDDLCFRIFCFSCCRCW